MKEAPSNLPAGGVTFATTHPPMAEAASSHQGTGRSPAELCRDFWVPLYGFVRGRGYEIPAALGIVHDFMSELAADSPAGATGAVRPFLLASLKYHLFRRQDRKMSPDVERSVSVFPTDADVRREEEFLAVAKTSAAVLGEDQLFEWRWAEVLVRRALDGLSNEYAAGRQDLLDALRPFLAGGTGIPTITDAARRLRVSLETVETELAALRSKYGAALRQEVARTVDRVEQVTDELRQLSRTLAGAPAAA